MLQLYGRRSSLTNSLPVARNSNPIVRLDTVLVLQPVNSG